MVPGWYLSWTSLTLTQARPVSSSAEKKTLSYYAHLHVIAQGTDPMQSNCTLCASTPGSARASAEVLQARFCQAGKKRLDGGC